MQLSAKWQDLWAMHPHGVEGRRIQNLIIGGESVEVVRLGQGDPIVVVPGLAGSWRLLWPTVRSLARHFEVIAFGLSGDHGASDDLDGGVGRIRAIGDYAQDVVSLIDQLGLDCPAVFGVSFGGAIALELAAEHPDRLGALILHGAEARFRPNIGSRIARRVLERFPLPSDSCFINQFFHLLFGTKPEPGPLVDFVIDRIWETGQRVMAERLAQLESFDISDRLWSIGAPDPGTRRWSRCDRSSRPAACPGRIDFRRQVWDDRRCRSRRVPDSPIGSRSSDPAAHAQGAGDGLNGDSRCLSAVAGSGLPTSLRSVLSPADSLLTVSYGIDMVRLPIGLPRHGRSSHREVGGRDSRDRRDSVLGLRPGVLPDRCARRPIDAVCKSQPTMGSCSTGRDGGPSTGSNRCRARKKKRKQLLRRCRRRSATSHSWSAGASGRSKGLGWSAAWTTRAMIRRSPGIASNSSTR